MERTLIDHLIDILQSKLGWTASWASTKSNGKTANKDGQLQINTEEGACNLICEIKKSVIPSSIPSILNILQSTDLNIVRANSKILLANYISTKAREQLQQRKINYADTAGNIFLKCKGIYIHIETGQSDRSALTNETDRAFTKTGLRVIYQFFRTNKIVTFNDPYRKIANEAEVSKDTVAKVIMDLLSKGYIIRQNKDNFKWRAKKDLFEQWVQSYNQTLRPKLKKQRFKHITEPQNLHYPPKGYQIAGYNAVNQYYDIPHDKQIISPKLIYYTNLPIKESIQNLNVIPSQDGRVIVYESFWKNEPNDHAAVDNIISYADLILENDPRYLDIANLLYQKSYHDKL